VAYHADAGNKALDESEKENPPSKLSALIYALALTKHKQYSQSRQEYENHILSLFAKF